MSKERCVALLLCACLTGCGAETSSDYRAVDAESPAPAVDAAPAVQPAAVPEMPSEDIGKPVPLATTADVEPADAADLAVSDARPFAVPLPETLPEVADSGVTANAGASGVGMIKLLIPEKSFSPEGPEKALRVTFDDIDLLKVLNMEPVPVEVEDYLPDWLAGLDGQRIRLRGWMFPPSREDGISRFMFVRDNGICCFGRRPKVYDKVAVRLKDGSTTHYIQGRPFDVMGILSVEADIEDGEVNWLYALSDAVVIDE